MTGDTLNPAAEAVGVKYAAWGLFGCVISGLIAGMIVGFVAEYYTTGRSIREIANACRTGSATNIIAGFAIGMKSTVLPLIVLALAILVSPTPWLVSMESLSPPSACWVSQG